MTSSTFSLKTVFPCTTSLPCLGPNISTSLSQKSVPFPVTNPFLSQNVKLSVANNGCNVSNPSKRSSLNSSKWNFMTWCNSERPTKVQELVVYEFNEGDRGSPVYLRLANKTENILGDIVPYTNKIYTGDLNKRLGITCGSLLVMNNPSAKIIKGLDRYEATFSMYFGDYGHISCQGPYMSTKDTVMAVTGGTGIFQGVYGQVKCSNLNYPISLHYTFQLKGIATLPAELTQTPLAPRPDLKPSPQAKATEPHAVVANFTQ